MIGTRSESEEIWNAEKENRQSGHRANRAQRKEGSEKGEEEVIVKFRESRTRDNHFLDGD